jgi:hypothetical protein
MRRGLTGLAAGAALLAAVALSAAEEVHGADSVFRGETVSIVWGVLHDPRADDAVAVTRIVNTARRYRYVSVEGVDPFGGGKTVLADGLPLDEQVEVRSPRGGFAAHPRREIHLFRDAVELRARTPALTVYYLGIPDTTPEFTSEAALAQHFATMLKPGGRP